MLRSDKRWGAPHGTRGGSIDSIPQRLFITVSYYGLHLPANNPLAIDSCSARQAQLSYSLCTLRKAQICLITAKGVTDRVTECWYRIHATPVYWQCPISKVTQQSTEKAKINQWTMCLRKSLASHRPCPISPGHVLWKRSQYVMKGATKDALWSKLAKPGDAPVIRRLRFPLASSGTLRMGLTSLQSPTIYWSHRSESCFGFQNFRHNLDFPDQTITTTHAQTRFWSMSIRLFPMFMELK